ncbi:MAG: SPFH domain-containing protein [Cyclobacteriaceae bacterium]|nr:SPFH domain-containing protein [Cyclobacteriaceae bacterium]
MTNLGFFLIVVAVVMAIMINVFPSRTETQSGPSGINLIHRLVKIWSIKKSIILGLVGIAFATISGLFFYNPAGTATAIQYLWGGDAAVTTQGVKLKFWGKTIPISFEIALQDIIIEKDSNGDKISDLGRTEEGIYHRNAQTREFADAIKADIAAALIVSINYNNSELFLEMADKNRSESKLVYARIYPVYDQALKNTCKLMDAQDYISGASSQFDYYLKDQMENGMYLTEEVYESINETLINPTDSNRTVAMGRIDNNEKREKRYRIRKDASGEPIRDASNSLKRYGLTVQQVAVTNIDWEASFDNRLKDQKEQVAQTQLEKQEAEKEYYATQKAIAKGEREKAETRVQLEKQQLEQTITAETASKTASYKEQEETNLLAAARKSAEKIRVIADAEAYEISKKVSAGITPEKRLQMELDASVERTRALAGPNGIQLPTTVFGGSNGKEAGMLESILGAKILSGEIGNK